MDNQALLFARIPISLLSAPLLPIHDQNDRYHCFLRRRMEHLPLTLPACRLRGSFQTQFQVPIALLYQSTRSFYEGLLAVHDKHFHK